ncbi:hypothetical protein ACJMK2_036894 [Sinanodonta woodiana]|uniref:Uncharacterized protein n=1 Tax=Sinanodonta woodiana TaxID=1069815 RepID=A0ABD3WIM5_SINWO
MTEHHLHDFIAGAFGGAAGLVVGHPFDTTKVQLQIHQQGGTLDAIKHIYKFGWPNLMKLYKGPIDCAASIIKERGIVGMYKGGVAMAVREIPTYGIYCLTYEVLNAKMHENKLTDSKGIVASLLAGGVAGSLTWLSILPVDVIKSRYQADCNGKYKGLLDCTYKCYQEGGIRIFYRGFLITCARAFLVNAVTFLAYSHTLKYLEMKMVNTTGNVSPNEL